MTFEMKRSHLVYEGALKLWISVTAPNISEKEVELPALGDGEWSGFIVSVMLLQSAVRLRPRCVISKSMLSLVTVAPQMKRMINQISKIFSGSACRAGQRAERL